MSAMRLLPQCVECVVPEAFLVAECAIEGPIVVLMTQESSGHGMELVSITLASNVRTPGGRLKLQVKFTLGSVRVSTGAPLRSVFAKYSALSPCMVFAAVVHSSAPGTGFTTSPISDVPSTYRIRAAGTVFWSSRRGIDLGALPFALGELAYCTALTLVYLWHTIPVAKADKFALLPRKITTRCVKRPQKRKITF